MNKARRKEMNKAIGLMEEAKAILDTIAEEERSAYDNMSEGLQNGEKGSQIDTNATTLEEARDTLETAIAEMSNVEGGE